MLQALVFDFDGVIVDTETQWYLIYRDWLKQTYGYDLQLRDYLVCVGSNSERLFSFIEQELGIGKEVRCFEKQAKEGFMERTKQLPAMEGVKEILIQAKQRGLKIALATSATRQKPEYHLNRLGLMEYFDAFATAELVSHIKPAPDLFEKAAELLDCTCEQCLAVEDSVNGLRSAQNAQMPCLIVPNRITASSDFQGAYQIVSSLANVDIDAIIQAFEKK